MPGIAIIRYTSGKFDKSVYQIRCTDSDEKERQSYRDVLKQTWSDAPQQDEFHIKYEKCGSLLDLIKDTFLLFASYEVSNLSFISGSCSVLSMDLENDLAVSILQFLKEKTK